MNYFNYFTEIEETFIRRRGKHLLLSPLDWALIESWQKKGIPLRIVLRGIENVFDAAERDPSRRRNIKSLSYCRDEIETQYSNWLETQVGKVRAAPEKARAASPAAADGPDPFPGEENVGTRLGNAAAALERAAARTGGELADVLGRTAERVRELAAGARDPESLENSLGELEALVDRTLLATADRSVVKNHEREIEKELARHRSKMEADVYRRTFDLMLLKKLRERDGIPRLSLFYL